MRKNYNLDSNVFPVDAYARIEEFLNSEKSKQGTRPDPLVGDTRLLGTGCSATAIDAMEIKGLDAAPLGHKIEDEKFCRACGKKEWRYEGDVKVWNCKCVYF